MGCCEAPVETGSGASSIVSQIPFSLWRQHIGSEREAMFAFLVCLLVVVFGLALMSSVGIIVIHKLFSPPLPRGIQDLHDLLMKILSGSAKLILGPFELFKHLKISIGGGTADRLPPKDIHQLTEQ
jgi:hypothetical protein